jgi:alpha-amylase/alpha-mannosidase (GH57 family)
MIQRILKMLGALGTNTFLTVVTQLLLPPAFLHYYGVTKYGEWIVLFRDAELSVDTEFRNHHVCQQRTDDAAQAGRSGEIS